jgi:MftR C-terminal domain
LATPPRAAPLPRALCVPFEAPFVPRFDFARLAERTGTDVDRDLYPRLVAAAIVSAVHVALDYWLDSPGTSTLRSTLSDALQQVAAGLPAPTTHGLR